MVVQTPEIIGVPIERTCPLRLFQSREDLNLSPIMINNPSLVLKCRYTCGEGPNNLVLRPLSSLSNFPSPKEFINACNEQGALHGTNGCVQWLVGIKLGSVELLSKNQIQ